CSKTAVATSWRGSEFRAIRALVACEAGTPRWSDGETVGSHWKCRGAPLSRPLYRSPKASYIEGIAPPAKPPSAARIIDGDVRPNQSESEIRRGRIPVA